VGGWMDGSKSCFKDCFNQKYVLPKFLLKRKAVTKNDQLRQVQLPGPLGTQDHGLILSTKLCPEKFYELF
jgi:hypothetical protein